MIDPLNLARTIAVKYSIIPGVEAVVMAGSQATGKCESDSDLDLYVYSVAEIPLAERRKIAPPDAEIGNQFWEPGDEWKDPASGIGIDVMFRTPEWIESQLDRVLRFHQASVGYSTCFWHNVLSSIILFDLNQWFRKLQERSRVPYPQELVDAIVAKNYPILRENQSSYMRQIEKAIHRGDWISIQHRVTALLASYFDIIFALNRAPHPGEKRLLQWTEKYCSHLPDQMNQNIQSLLRGVATADQSVLSSASRLLDGLDQLLMQMKN